MLVYQRVDADPVFLYAYGVLFFLGAERSARPNVLRLKLGLPRCFCVKKSSTSRIEKVAVTDNAGPHPKLLQQRSQGRCPVGLPQQLDHQWITAMIGPWYYDYYDFYHPELRRLCWAMLGFWGHIWIQGRYGENPPFGSIEVDVPATNHLVLGFTSYSYDYHRVNHHLPIISKWYPIFCMVKAVKAMSLWVK